MKKLDNPFSTKASEGTSLSDDGKVHQTESAKVTNNNTTSKIKKYFFATASMAILVGIVVIYYKPNLVFSLLNMASQATVGENIKDKSQKRLDAEVTNEMQVQEEEQAASEPLPQVITEPLVAEDKNTKQELELQPTEVISQAKVELPNYKETLELYRDYLATVNLLVIQFLQDKDFTKELDELRSNKLKFLEPPHSIANTLLLLERYNDNYIVNYHEQKKLIFPKEEGSNKDGVANKVLDYSAWLLSKFVKVEKLPKYSREKDLLRAQIIENLPKLNEMLYSEQLQDIFVGKVSK